MVKGNKNIPRRFVVYAYALFWIMLAAFSAVYVVTGQNPNVLKYGSWVCSWAPTIALLLLFKRIYPGTTIKDFYKKAFGQRIRLTLVFAIAALYILLLAAITFAVSAYSKVPVKSLLDLSLPTLLTGVVMTALSGPLGEESGWRGYLLPELWNKAGVIKGALLMSAVWAPWHAPLWFLSGAAGIQLAEYIGLFILGNICLSIVISVCYDYNRNLFIPIWIHFMSNAIEIPYRGDFFAGRVFDVLFYVLIAAGFILWYKIRTHNGRAVNRKRTHISEGKP